MMSIPVAVLSKSWVYGGSFPAIVGSNPVGVMEVSCECFVLSVRRLCDGLTNFLRSTT
jgi:hypothetical protein